MRREHCRPSAAIQPSRSNTEVGVFLNGGCEDRPAAHRGWDWVHSLAL